MVMRIQIFTILALLVKGSYASNDTALRFKRTCYLIHDGKKSPFPDRYTVRTIHDLKYLVLNVQIFLHRWKQWVSNMTQSRL